MSGETAWDLILVGGGPAGSTMATLVKKYNPRARVLLLEKETFPRHHVGESLLPGSNAVLKEMGVYDALSAAGFVRKIGVTFVWGRDRRPWDADFSQAKFELQARHGLESDLDLSWQVPRAQYDSILLDHARASGVTVWSARALAPLMRGGAVTGLRAEKDGRVLDLRARLVADCSGQAGVVSSVRGRRRFRPSLKNVAGYAYFKGARWKFEFTNHPDKTRIFVCSVPEGWFWYIPIARDVVSVGLVAKQTAVRAAGAPSLEAYYSGALERCRELAPLLRGARRLPGMDAARPEKDFFSAGDWSFTSERSCGPGWIAAGDAAFFIDPLLSSGVMMAHHSAHQAAYTVTTAWAARSESERRRVWRHYDSFCGRTADHFLRLVEYWYHHDPNASRWRGLARRALGGSAPVDLSDEGSFAAVVAGLSSRLERLYTGPLGAVQPTREEARRSWSGGANRDIPVPYLFLTGANRKVWSKLRSAAGRRAGPALDGAVRPRWTSKPRFTTELVPVEGTGLLRRISVLSARTITGEPLRRLLPDLLVALLRRVDGRRSVGEIEALACAASAAPREEVSRQLQNLLLDLVTAGVLDVSRRARSAPPAAAVGPLRESEALFAQGRWGEAERALSGWRGLRACPYGLALRGEARRRQGALESACADLDAALTERPSGPAAGDLSADVERGWTGARAFAWRALARLDSGRAEQALEDAEAALSLDPRSEDARRARATALERLGRPAPAEAAGGGKA